MRRLALYAFVVSIVWLSFVVAISFIEAPAKFTALKLEKIEAVIPAL